MFNAQQRIRQLMDERGWTIYRLAQESKLSQTTISNIFKRNNQPSIPTVNAICDACGITLAQFFAEDDPANTLNTRSEFDNSVAALKEKNYWIGVETNGTHDADWLAFVDYVACSPKMEYESLYCGAGTSAPLGRADEVRVVASDERAVAFCEKIRKAIAATDYYVSPCDHDGKVDFATAKSVLSQLDGWSLSVQLHKLLGFR